MREVYLDNAATSRQKPEKVKKAIMNYFTKIGCSPGRGGYECSLQAGRIILEARSLLADFFNVTDTKRLIFTANVTHSLNYTIKGLLDKGDHVITTSMEHNSILRPLHSLEENDIINVDYICCSQKGVLDPNKVRNKINENTKMIVLTHASNVTGTIMPVSEIASIVKNKDDIFFVLDTAQSAGVYNIDFQELNLDILAFTGHKGLYGPPGTGGFAVSKKAADKMKPLIEGGTGSISDKEFQPDFLPDKFESGTMNTPGIAGLKAGVEFIVDKGLDKIRNHELELAQKFIEGLKSIPEIKIYGPANIKKQAPTISIAIEGKDLGEMSCVLDEKYGIMTRSGLHCAPYAHQTIGSFPQGTLRFS
ncbi:MAG: aminotransferase class V-fold PLP-dependent enzyme, partial [Halanaerobiales bacterium]